MGTIQKQGLINTVIVYIGVVLGFINTIVVQPHYLHPDEVGLVRVLLGFSSFLTPFLLIGSSNMCARYFPVFRNPEKRHHGFLGFVLSLTLAGILAGGIVIYAARKWIIARYIAESPLFVDFFGWVFPLAAVMAISIAVNVYCNSLFKSTFPSFLNDIWVRLLLIGFTFVYVFGWCSLRGFITGIWIAYLSQLILLMIYIFTVDRPGFRIDWPFVRSVGLSQLLRYSFLLMLTALSTLSMKFLDVMMIGAYLPLKFAGIYSIGLFMAQFIETPIYSVERIAGTKIAHAFNSNNSGEIREIYYRSVRYLFLFGGFLGVGIITNVHDFLRLLSPEYREAANVTIIISVGSIINMATGVNTPILQNSSRYVWGMIFLLILLVLSVLLNLLFIPRFGIEGAAFATGLASVLYNAMKFLYIWKKFDLQPYDLRSVKTLAVIGLSLAAGLLLPVPENPWLAILVRGGCITMVYAATTFFLNIVPEYHRLLGKRFAAK